MEMDNVCVGRSFPEEHAVAEDDCEGVSKKKFWQNFSLSSQESLIRDHTPVSLGEEVEV